MGMLIREGPQSRRTQGHIWAMRRVYEEIIDFLVAGCTPDVLINEGLAPEETSELNHWMELEHILTLAKARARAKT
jgi:hypothetical protein